MNLGVIASNFPPWPGGMQEHARGLVQCLAANHHVSLFVRPGSALPNDLPNLTINNQMTWYRRLDMPTLQKADVEAWLILDSGLADYLPTLVQPGFVYAHGNDFIRPWFPREDLFRRGQSRLFRALRLPGAEAMTRSWRRRRIGRSLRAVAGVFANSQFSRDRCLQMFRLPPEMVHVVPPGISSEFFQEVTRVPREELRLLSVARLETSSLRKNVEGVLRALAALGAEFPYLYTVIGDGDDRPRLEDLARELSISDRVRFCGHATRDLLLLEYAANDVMVLPVQATPTDQEGFGMVFAEAAAAGMPSIATISGGIVDVVRPGLTGLLLQESGPLAIAEGIRAFRRKRDSFDPERIRNFARQFSAEACTSKLMDIISKRVPPSPVRH
jgi:glycosyltransferase involved in cell wall biosynthesis